jgi:hypothetical protein
MTLRHHPPASGPVPETLHHSTSQLEFADVISHMVASSPDRMWSGLPTVAYWRAVLR